MWVNPRNVRVSGLRAPRFRRFSAANRPNSISRVFSGVQGQAELLKSLPQFSEEPFGLATVLEPHDEIVGITHDDHVARGGCGPPPLDPKVEDVMQEYVRQEW
jgi:hypothetical protein